MKARWLDRRIAHPGPYLTLCLSQAEFRSALLHLKSPDLPRWVNVGAHATTHTFEHEDYGIACVVCLNDYSKRSAIEIAGMLVHEAVHVWQHYCDDIGERAPGAEQEAYGIQVIAQELLAEYARRQKE